MKIEHISEPIDRIMNQLINFTCSHCGESVNKRVSIGDTECPCPECGKRVVFRITRNVEPATNPTRGGEGAYGADSDAVEFLNGIFNLKEKGE